MTIYNIMNNDFDFDVIMNELEETYINYDLELNKYNKIINTNHLIEYSANDIYLIMLITFIQYYMILSTFCYFYNIELLNIIFLKLLKV